MPKALNAVVAPTPEVTPVDETTSPAAAKEAPVPDVCTA